MPIYDVNCPQCGELTDIWAKVEEINVKCPMCGKETQRLLSPTRIICDLEPYFDENLADVKKAPQGCYVESRQDRKRKLKEFGLVEMG
jgi:putative FmdB family regulatory protein